MIIRDVKQRHPETIPVFEGLHYRHACDDCDIETVARKNGLRSLDVIEALNRPCSDQRQILKMQATSKPAKRSSTASRIAAGCILLAQDSGHRRYRNGHRQDAPGTWSPARSAARLIRSTPNAPAYSA
jgi:hypothetical protein